MISEESSTNYVDPEAIAKEVVFAKRLFVEKGWPVINIARRSIEETAATILNLLAQYQEEKVD